MIRSSDRTGKASATSRGPSRTTLACLVGVAAILFAATACGQDDGDAIVFDGPMTTTTSIAISDTTPTTSPPGPKLGPWVDVTGNLAGMDSECGNTSAVAGRPGTDQVIAGIALQGLWSTNAGSDQWARMDGGSPTQIRNRTVSLIFDPRNPNQFWESGSYGAPGVVRTGDGGRTFESLGASVDHAEGLSVDLSDPAGRTLLVGTHERQDLFRSTDGGANWVDVAPALEPGVFAHYPLFVDGQTYLLGANGQGGGGIFRTTDAGVNWQKVVPTAVAGPALLASDGSIYWALSNGGMVKSTDKGANWTRPVTNGTLSPSSNVIELSGGRIAALGARTVVVSGNKGATWSALGPALPIGDAKGVAYSEQGNAVFVWTWDCGTKVPPRSVQRLSLTPTAG